MANFILNVKTLTPLHIGSGDELRQGFDFIVKNGRTYRLDVDAILAAKGDRMTPSRAGSYPRPDELLTSNDLSNPAFFRYSLAGSPRSGQADARLKACIKDVYDCAYIPGSSLKGAFRTALAWSGWKEVNPRLERGAIGRKPKDAAQPLERELFGPNPNHDLLRALQVGDCIGSQKPGDRLRVVNAQVLTMRRAGSPVELEAISGDTEFSGVLRIDDTLFSPLAEHKLHFSKRRHWLDELTARVQRHSQARIGKLIAWFERAEGAEDVAKFYRRLAEPVLAPNQALLQLGWGTGWDGTTFGTHLQTDIHLFEVLVRDFRLHKANRQSPPRRAGDPFPRSKRVAMKVKEGRAAPAAPFGWVVLEINPA